MSNENTITIPADLREGFTSDDIRDIAASVVPHPEGDPDAKHMARQLGRVLGWLADEIERQAPREPGWYFVYRTDRAAGKFYHWNGKDWAQTESRSYSEPVGLAPGITAESVIFESGAS